MSALGSVKLFSDYSTELSKLGYYLQAKSPCDLLVIALKGASGMNLCDKGRKGGSFPIIWISDQAEFALQANRLGVDCFLTEPVTGKELAFYARQLLLGKHS